MSRVEVVLSVAELRRAGACEGGIRIVAEFAKTQGHADEARLLWDGLGSAWAWTLYPDHCSWLAAKGMIPSSTTAGARGTATAGARGTATAGARGTIRIRWWDGAAKRYRWANGDVGENGIVANVAYVVREGRLARKDGAL